VCRQLFTASWKLNYSYQCQLVDYSDNPDEMRVRDFVSSEVKMISNSEQIQNKTLSIIRDCHLYLRSFLYQTIYTMSRKSNQTKLGASVPEYVCEKNHQIFLENIFLQPSYSSSNVVDIRRWLTLLWCTPVCHFYHTLFWGYFFPDTLRESARSSAY